MFKGSIRRNDIRYLVIVLKISIAQLVRDWTTGIRTQAERGYFPSPSCTDEIWGVPSCSVSRFLWSVQSLKLTTHFHIVVMSAMNGALPELPTYAIVAWRLGTRTALLIYYMCEKHHLVIVVLKYLCTISVYSLFITYVPASGHEKC
jgi:hypothetical protein